jgi:predicted transcriptional regulator
MTHRVLTAHVSKELARRVDALAQRLDRPRGWIMKEALALFVELEQKRDTLTREALDEVELGQTVDHAHIEAWAASLRKRRRR